MLWQLKKLHSMLVQLHYTGHGFIHLAFIFLHSPILSFAGSVFPHLAVTGHLAGRSLFWSSCCVRCCSPVRCLPQNASRPLDHPREWAGKKSKLIQLSKMCHHHIFNCSAEFQASQSHHHLETGILPRLRFLWPWRRGNIVFKVFLFAAGFKCQLVKGWLTSVGAGLLSSIVCGWASDISDSFSSSSSWMGEDGDLRVLDLGTKQSISQQKSLYLHAYYSNYINAFHMKW